ncbi:MAG: glucuronate isomerase [Prevotellaceae bacterium]|jgi:glucuronate isomerase|nr:glucuronate isomerase [Prevotellaceae bacterium]
MKNFLDPDFLLQTATAQKLYHEHAENQPIIDYHCHLNPQQVAEDYRFRSITELWLGGDHYKWRAMRANGINEHFITGGASDWEKFEKWAETVPYTMRNPLYHWTHLELKTAFGITKLLSPETAQEIFNLCNEKLQSHEFSARNLMRKYRVEAVCTTDDPTDTLEYHKKTRESGFELKMLPTWRPDKAIMIDDTENFCAYVEKLSDISGVNITGIDDYIYALMNRHDFFASQGCKLSDHGFEDFYAKDYDERAVKMIFGKAINNYPLKTNDIGRFKTAMLVMLAEMDWEKGWTQQFHYGVIRNNNTRMFQKTGADTGFDSISNTATSKKLATFLDTLEKNGTLAKTIIYNLNPADNEMLATMLGNFQDGSVAGKMQFGSAWWFLDQKDGIERQLNTLSNFGLLSRFVGMLTDSRSFLSYTRHEYFRRILCNLLGNDIENGLLPASEFDFIGKMVENICYKNAKKFFKF